MTYGNVRCRNMTYVSYDLRQRTLPEYDLRFSTRIRRPESTGSKKGKIMFSFSWSVVPFTESLVFVVKSAVNQSRGKGGMYLQKGFIGVRKPL